MTATSQIVEGVWQLNLGAVNAFLIADADRQGESTLIDTGTPNSEGKSSQGSSRSGRRSPTSNTSSSRTAALDFDVAVFGHGGPIKSGASQKCRATFA